MNNFCDVIEVIQLSLLNVGMKIFSVITLLFFMNVALSFKIQIELFVMQNKIV